MSTPVTLHKSPDTRELPPANPLDEAVWQAWVAKGRARAERSYATRMKAVKWISLVGLLLGAAAGFGSHLTPYETVIRFLVAVGSLAVMFQATQARQYAFAIVFGALALLYNPVAPLFRFSGEWQGAVMVASTVPFVASLTWRDAKLVPNE